MGAISMYRGNLHLSGGASAGTARRWEAPRPAISPKRFRLLLRSRSLAIARLAGAAETPAPPPPTGSPAPSSPSSSRLVDGRAAEPAGEAPEEQVQQQQDAGMEQQQQQQAAGEEQQQPQPQPEEVEVEQQDQQQPQEDAGEEEREEGAVEDAEMEDAGEVVVEGDGSKDPEEGQGESEGVDPSQEASYPDGIEERKKHLNENLDVLNKKKHDLVQMLKQVLNAEEEMRRRKMQASLHAANPQPLENATDGISVNRLPPRMTVDVNFGEVAGDSEAGSNQGTPGRPLNHFHSISPSTASFMRSPFGSMQHNSGHTPRSPATFSTASPSRFASSAHQGQPPGLHSASLPGTNYVTSSPSPAASGGSSSVFRDHRPPNST